MSMQPTTNKLDKRITRVWRIHEGIALVIVALIAACVSAGMYFGGLAQEGPGAATAMFWINVGVWALTAAQLVSFIVEPPLRYSRWRYEVTNTDVILKHGIVVSKSVVIPLVRVQHVEDQAGPHSQELWSFRRHHLDGRRQLRDPRPWHGRRPSACATRSPFLPASPRRTCNHGAGHQRTRAAGEPRAGRPRRSERLAAGSA